MIRRSLHVLIAAWVTFTTAALLVPLNAFAQSTNYTYDSLNRLTGVVYADGTTIAYTYDASGNRLSTSTSGGCSFGLSAGSATYPASGGSGSVNVIPSAANCPWTAASNDAFLNVTTASGTGPGGVAGQIAHHGVELRERQSKPVVRHGGPPSSGQVIADCPGSGSGHGQGVGSRPRDC